MATIQNVYTSNKVSFSYYNYNKGIFFDEKKKRFVDFADMDQISYMNYKRPFKWYRPDYFGGRSVFHDKEVFGLANVFLEYMHRMRMQELGRMYILFRRNYLLYMQPLYENNIKYGSLDQFTQHKYLKWDDASITVGYLEYVLNRIKKYGLNHGPLDQRKFPNYKESLKAEEDRLAEYFLYEMRKEPQKEQNIPEMPFN